MEAEESTYERERGRVRLKRNNVRVSTVSKGQYWFGFKNYQANVVVRAIFYMSFIIDDTPYAYKVPVSLHHNSLENFRIYKSSFRMG